MPIRTNGIYTLKGQPLHCVQGKKKPIRYLRVVAYHLALVYIKIKRIFVGDNTNHNL
ncbi:hypothetical protein IX332_000270 [Porphyromonas levii]|nr:hypothetical protein [Porphyromonas levii]MBR8728962.1 hypothetical protein [Porphyromonas levii]MBR8763133.1 hypothetical protein [Porphyromonas levii]MBR8769228.1 hypothetical protein [Porphyromonas levii]